MPGTTKGGRITPAKNKNIPEVTPLDEWDSVEAPVESGFICELPSGRFVRVIRTLDLALLLQEGRIPNPLAPIVRKMMKERDANIPMEQIAGDDVLLSQLMDLLQGNAQRMMIEPKVSVPRRRGYDDNGVKFEETQEEHDAYLEEWTPAPGTLSIFRIGVNDLLYLFTVGQGAAADLESFRGGQNPIMAPVSTEQGVGDKAKRATKRK